FGLIKDISVFVLTLFLIFLLDGRILIFVAESAVPRSAKQHAHANEDEYHRPAKVEQKHQPEADHPQAAGNTVPVVALSHTTRDAARANDKQDTRPPLAGHEQHRQPDEKHAPGHLISPLFERHLATFRRFPVISVSNTMYAPAVKKLHSHHAHFMWIIGSMWHNDGR